MYKDYLKKAIQIAYEAGLATLNYYKAELQVEIKADNSPLTLADKASNDVIVSNLSKFSLPVLTEESELVDYSIRKNWTKYWLIDPLDGTKEFIKKSDEYTVNIALIDEGKPVLGVVYAPAKDLLFYGLLDYGSFKVNDVSKNDLEKILGSPNNTKLPVKNSNDIPVVVASKSHKNQETVEYIEKIKEIYGQVIEENYGSSLKLCMVAEGSADIYPRIGPTMEWDTAASHAVVEAAGQYILTYPELKPMEYNKENLLNPFFIVFNQKMKKAVLP